MGEGAWRRGVVRSPERDALRRLRRNKLALVGIAIIGFVMLVALLVFLWYVFVLVVVVALGIKLKQYYANKRLGNVVIDTGSSITSPEDVIPVKLCFFPAKAVEVTTASATLTGKEILASAHP